MSLNLTDGEVLKLEAKIHWISYLKSFLISGIAWIVLFSGLTSYYLNNAQPDNSTGALALPFGIIALLPIAAQWLKNRFTKYRLTNRRIQIRQGILSRSTSDLPLNKVNDISLKQNIFQRLVGAGTILILTGNDNFSVLENVADPERFRDIVSETVSQR